MTRRIVLALFVLSMSAWGAAPQQSSVETVLGPKAYRDGDVVEITDVLATSPLLEQGDTVVVKGRVRLDSQTQAQLGLYLTQTQGDGGEETDATQTTTVTEGLHDFELKITIKHRGVLHLTLYDLNARRPIGGSYFGTEAQMESVADWSLERYLQDK